MWDFWKINCNAKLDVGHWLNDWEIPTPCTWKSLYDWFEKSLWCDGNYPTIFDFTLTNRYQNEFVPISNTFLQTKTYQACGFDLWPCLSAKVYKDSVIGISQISFIWNFVWINSIKREKPFSIWWRKFAF